MSAWHSPGWRIAITWPAPRNTSSTASPNCLGFDNQNTFHVQANQLSGGSARPSGLITWSLVASQTSSARAYRTVAHRQRAGCGALRKRLVRVIAHKVENGIYFTFEVCEHSMASLTQQTCPPTLPSLSRRPLCWARTAGMPKRKMRPAARPWSSVTTTMVAVRQRTSR